MKEMGVRHNVKSNNLVNNNANNTYVKVEGKNILPITINRKNFQSRNKLLYNVESSLPIIYSSLKYTKIQLNLDSS